MFQKLRRLKKVRKKKDKLKDTNQMLLPDVIRKNDKGTVQWPPANVDDSDSDSIFLLVTYTFIHSTACGKMLFFKRFFLQPSICSSWERQLQVLHDSQRDFEAFLLWNRGQMLVEENISLLAPPKHPIVAQQCSDGLQGSTFRVQYLNHWGAYGPPE